MNIRRSLKMLVPPVVMLITGISYADVVEPTVDFPALDIHGLGADSIYLTIYNFNIDATAISIVTLGDPIDIPDTAFSLRSSGLYDEGIGSFSGSFNVGSLLSGTFSGSVLSLGGADGQFYGDLIYTGGSLMSELIDGGRIEGAYGDDEWGNFGMVAKLGEVAVVPVPAAVWLFGSGLLGLVGVARRKA